MGDARLEDLWQLVPGGGLPGELELVGESQLRSAFCVDDCAALSSGLAALAALALGYLEGAAALPVRLDRAHIAADFSGQFLVDGEAPQMWADLSGYYETRGGDWLQLHCNFPHHAAGVVKHLGLASGETLPPRSVLEACMAKLDATELEGELIEAGMIAAKLRSLDEWEAHPHAVATRDLPLMEVRRLGSDVAKERPGEVRRPLRVLDTSRVIAGPVAGRTLAALGADVLRVGAERLPAIEAGLILTGMGKRNAFVDLDAPGGVEAFERLLAGADVWIDAYRPGSFARRGLTPERAAELAPGIIVIQISAFDWTGPWAGRRGFDSIVQSTTGLVDEGMRRSGSSRPTPLPVQALDFATGYLAAFAALRLASARALEGGSWLARLSLLRTRNWFVGLGAPVDFEPKKPTLDLRFTQELDSDFGRLTVSRPLIGSWRSAPRQLGTSPASWLPPHSR